MAVDGGDKMTKLPKSDHSLDPTEFDFRVLECIGKKFFRPRSLLCEAMRGFEITASKLTIANMGNPAVKYKRYDLAPGDYFKAEIWDIFPISVGECFSSSSLQFMSVTLVDAERLRE